MKSSILISLEIYFIAFVIATLMAFIIKGMHVVIRRFSNKEEAMTDK